MEKEVYEIEWFTEFFHSFPHFDLTFGAVNSTFNPQDPQYRQSLVLWSLVPVLYLVVLLLVLYLSYRCRQRDGKPAPQGAWNWALILLKLTVIAGTGLGVYGNRQTGMGMREFATEAEDVTQNVAAIAHKIRQLDAVINGTVNQGLQGLQSDVQSYDQRTINPHTKARLEELLSRSNEYTSAMLQQVSEVLGPDASEHVGEVMYFIDQAQLYGDYGWFAVVAYLVWKVGLCFLLLCGYRQASNCTLKTFSALGILTLVICWAATGLLTALSVGVADFCADPDGYIQHRSNAHLDPDLVKYLVPCNSSEVISEHNALQTATDNLHHANQTVTRALDLVDDLTVYTQDLEEDADQILTGLESASTHLKSLERLVNCTNVGDDYTEALNGLCNTALPGLGWLLLCCVKTGHFFAVLVAIALHTLGRFKQKNDNEDVEEVHPFLPRSNKQTNRKKTDRSDRVQPSYSGRAAHAQIGSMLNQHSGQHESPPPPYSRENYRMEELSTNSPMALGHTVSAMATADDYYFDEKGNNCVTLYQDAHTPQMALFNNIKYEDGTTYKATSCWQDLSKAIGEANRLIYITGWSLSTKISLVREGKGQTTLGELLKKKANEGVTVLIAVWSETFRHISGMHVYDKETCEYFKNSKVIAERWARVGLWDPQDIAYSHHQKSVTLDAPHPNGGKQRRLVAFIGGLDLTIGRYDTPQHPLYSTLNGAHRKDFLQNVIKSERNIGPREPWHDIHCKVEGPVAYQVLQNFTERVRAQGSATMQSKLVNLKTGFDLTCPGVCARNQMWHCRIHRSITHHSAKFEKDTDKTVDNTIQCLYVEQISKAQRFIYIENQYFIGSSQEWTDNKTAAPNLVPLSLVRRIEAAIQTGQRFAVYIVLPLFPEGHPGDAAMQAILCYQHKTIAFMYKRIAQALTRTNTQAIPTDYLNVYCLGTTERGPNALPNDLGKPDKGSDAELIRKTRRFMVYVHSKMMIVDDAYIVVGSANINERSMAGDRDTEIALGAYQKNYTASSQHIPRGGVSGFRKALWAEHLQAMDSTFDDPSSVQCVHKVNQVASDNFDIYASNTLQDTQGHLLKYPYSVDIHGNVTSVYGHEHFPDTNAAVLGNTSWWLPDVAIAQVGDQEPSASRGQHHTSVL